VEVESFFPGHEAIKPAMTLIKSGKVGTGKTGAKKVPGEIYLLSN